MRVSLSNRCHITTEATQALEVQREILIKEATTEMVRDHTATHFEHNHIFRHLHASRAEGHESECQQTMAGSRDHLRLEHQENERYQGLYEESQGARTSTSPERQRLPHEVEFQAEIRRLRRMLTTSSSHHPVTKRSGDAWRFDNQSATAKKTSLRRGCEKAQETMKSWYEEYIETQYYSGVSSGATTLLKSIAGSYKGFFFKNCITDTQTSSAHG